MQASSIPHLPIHHDSLPYTDEPTRLRTLDIWLPRPLKESDPKSNVWIVYVHGGAWRDPAQTSQCIIPTLKHLPPSTIAKIAGIASINYRLSPYPSHPDDPTTLNDEERNVRHPEHVKDIASALAYLSAGYRVGSKDGAGFQWLGIGHSCGATLLCQYISGTGLQGVDVDIAGPVGLILLEGVYDLGAFLANHRPPKCSADIAQIYEDIVVGAFTESEEVWRVASPVSGRFTREKWKEGRLVYLCYSSEDELVEEEQAEEMRKRFEEDGWVEGRDSSDGRVLEWKAFHGKHDWIWEDGTQIATRIKEMLERLDEHV